MKTEIKNLLKLDKQSFFELSDIKPKRLPKIWFSVKYNTPRIKIANKECTASISIEDNPKILKGKCNLYLL